MMLPAVTRRRRVLEGGVEESGSRGTRRTAGKGQRWRCGGFSLTRFANCAHEPDGSGAWRILPNNGQGTGGTIPAPRRGSGETWVRLALLLGLYFPETIRIRRGRGKKGQHQH